MRAQQWRTEPTAPPRQPAVQGRHRGRRHRAPRGWAGGELRSVGLTGRNMVAWTSSRQAEWALAAITTGAMDGSPRALHASGGCSAETSTGLWKWLGTEVPPDREIPKGSRHPWLWGREACRSGARPASGSPREGSLPQRRSHGGRRNLADVPPRHGRRGRAGLAEEAVPAGHGDEARPARRWRGRPCSSSTSWRSWRKASATR